MSSLERNYPSRVLYVEGRRSAQRISNEQIAPLLQGRRYDAVSSHLLTIPKLGERLGAVHVSLLRDPLERIRSAHRFLLRQGAIDANTTLEEFLEGNFQAHNFQARHSAIGCSPEDAADWRFNDQIYRKFESREIFFGLVELFDTCMLLLEQEVAAQGGTFDAAYYGVLNRSPGVDQASSGEDLRELCRFYNQHDYDLYDAVKARLLDTIETRISAEDVAAFRQRCRLLRKQAAKGCVPRVPDPKHWVYIDEAADLDIALP
jgi:hypothetical protein